MKKILLLLSSFGLALFNVFGQSNGCTTATVIGVTSDCLSPTAGTTIGATQTIVGCTGNADDDVWYQFTATSTSHQIRINPDAGMDPVVQLFSGGCGSLVSLSCKDSGLDGDEEVINYNGLSIGAVYRIRVYDYYAGSGTGTFSICVTTPEPAPSNDDCAGAIALPTVSNTCNYTLATTNGASESIVGCSGSADDDVWFSFVASNSLQNIHVNPIDNLDLVYQVYSGTCGSLSNLICVDNTFSSQDEQEDIAGLIPGQTYFIRVYDYYQGSTGDFNICVTGDPTPAPSNDEPCNAIALPQLTSACNYASFTTVGATPTQTAQAPLPSNCEGGSGAAIGGYDLSNSHDVWFSMTVPASGTVDITPQPNGSGGSITDGVMVLYSGNTCSSLTQIHCSDDYNYPGTSNDLLPNIHATGLTPGETVYLRYFGFGSSSGTFAICAGTTVNDDCENALYICDINGYSGTTSTFYTEDRPDGLHGNNETAAGTDLTDGIDSGGLFGAGGTWGTGSPNIDVNIDNNSWIRFTASATTATLNVDIYDCWNGAGIQMQIFEGDNCTGFVPKSNFEEDNSQFIITAVDLTVGNDYYLMVDGFAGDVCGYTITAESGVQFPDLEDVDPLCQGEIITLTAPPGATSYNWQHSGETTQTVTVTASTSQTYYCEVTGLCDYKQTLDAEVIIKPDPEVTITNGALVAICSGDNVDLIASGADTYEWSTTQIGASINVAPTTNTSYTVTGTLDGCTNDAVVNVNVNALPTLTATPTSSDADCGSSNGALNGALGSGTPTLTYTWTDGSSTVGTNQNLTNVPAGTYFLTITDGNTCSDMFGPFNIVNPGAPNAPTITVDDSTPCLDGSAQLTASGIANATYNWSGPGGFTSNNTTINLNNVTPADQGNYCVSATVAGCTGPSTCESIVILAPPSVNVGVGNNDSTICLGNDFTLTATGANSYSWTGPNGFISGSNTETITNASIVNEGYYVVEGIDGNGCSANDSILISIVSLPNVDVTANSTNATYCNGLFAQLDANGASSYNWSGPNGYASTGNTTIILDLSAASEGYYYVEGTDTEQCVNIDSIYVTVITDVPAAAPNDTTLCPGEKLILYGDGGIEYFWSGPNEFYSTDQNTLLSNNLTFDHTGWYTLTVTDPNGCLGYDSTYLEVTNNGDCLYIPNLITPDYDGKNDTWYINGLDGFEAAEVEIYNRWGNLIYYVSPYNNDWSGEVNRGTTVDGNNGKVPPGTYFYIIRLNEGDHEPFNGYVEVEY